MREEEEEAALEMGPEPSMEHCCLPKHPSPQFRNPYSTQTHSANHVTKRSLPLRRHTRNFN